MTRRLYWDCGNMFAALADDSDTDDEQEQTKVAGPLSPQREQKTATHPTSLPPPQRMYSLIVGRQRIRLGANDPAPYNLDSSIFTGTALNSVSFYGRCFSCQYMAHSQKYCPLRQCQSCKEYGHSEIVCVPSRAPSSFSSSSSPFSPQPTESPAPPAPTTRTWVDAVAFPRSADAASNTL